ncbi:MAG TPA: phosphatase PAP2 family protein [Alphaproteobacteria bacterium]|nr:hypothetical protein [Rhodospirillaceae bacterium]HRJ11847.1 phosphatase PAP2 family protein [Alphaproteobacteria bacterium]
MIIKFSKPIWLTLLAAATTVAVIPFDLAIMQYIHARPGAKPIFEIITEIGLSQWYLVPSALVILAGLYLWRTKKMTAAFARNMHVALLMFLSVASSGIFVNVMKAIIARARPREFLREEIHGFWNWAQVWAGELSDYNSFPSGHAATSLAVAVTIVLCLPKKYHFLTVPILVLGCIVAASRVMVSVHYLSDVIAGSVIGVWAAVLCKRYLARAKWAAAISRPATLQ